MGIISREESIIEEEGAEEKILWVPLILKGDDCHERFILKGCRGCCRRSRTEPVIEEGYSTLKAARRRGLGKEH